MNRILLTGASIAALLVAAPALAQNNDSDVTQSGSGAVATVDQTGANDVSDITQTGGGTVNVNQDGDTGSTSTVTTGANDRPPESTVDVTQSDDGSSSAGTSQANVSTVIQDNVNGFGLSGTGSTVSVTQTHNAAGYGQNDSYVQQGTNAVSGQVTVSQTGGENVSDYGSFTSTDNDASITQTGVQNTSSVVQNFQNGGALATVNQNGTGGMNNVYIEQVSDGFSATPPEFALGAEASATQNGSLNSSTISQTGYSEADATANYASSNQQGNGNTSSITQSGIEGFASLTQVGNGNDSLITQGGSGNSATVSQMSDGNDSIVTQNGTGNTAVVNQ